MDDDLLGGPSPSAAAAVPFDDDLLGGGGAPSQSAAFDDDLLFGGGPPSPKPTSHSHAGPSSQGSEKLTAEALGPKSAFKIKPVKEVAQSLVGLVDANTYFSALPLQHPRGWIAREGHRADYPDDGRSAHGRRDARSVAVGARGPGHWRCHADRRRRQDDR
jgi:hypothetical protein